MTWSAGDFLLEDLIQRWLGDLDGQVRGRTQTLYRLHWETHLLPWFGSLTGLNKARVREYCSRRLKVVKRSTLMKERSTLRSFLAWCRESGYLDESAFLIPDLPRRAAGTPYEVRRRGTATPLTPEECARLISALPLWSTPRGERAPFPVRSRFIVAYETSLRPATLDALSVPEHYSRGSDRLRISADIDKAAFAREVPLTPAAREALDSVVPEQGVIFGKHDYRDQLEAAAKRAKLAADKARTFCAYDLRHARATELAERNLVGAAHMLGHKQLTTTSLYVHTGFRAAERALAEGSDPTTSVRIVGLTKCPEEGCAKERTRTSTVVKPLAPQATDAVKHGCGSPASSVATELLRRACAGEQVERAELVAFARQTLAAHKSGRLALAVLDGSKHWERRALELAQLIRESECSSESEEVQS